MRVSVRRSGVRRELQQGLVCGCAGEKEEGGRASKRTRAPVFLFVVASLLLRVFSTAARDAPVRHCAGPPAPHTHNAATEPKPTLGSPRATFLAFLLLLLPPFHFFLLPRFLPLSRCDLHCSLLEVDFGHVLFGHHAHERRRGGPCLRHARLFRPFFPPLSLSLPLASSSPPL